MRALLRRLRGQEAGFTFVEVIASVVILGIIMVPLGTAMVFAYRTVFGIQDRLANSADVQRLSTYFPSDVASVDADGVNPARVEDENICKATATEQSLITFRWDEDLGDGGQTVVRYVATGSGKDSKVVRRICRGSDAPVETVLAKNFGEGTGAPEASTYLTDPDHPDLPPTPVCGTTSCYIDIHGAYTFHLEAQRRVEGDDGSNSPPGAPTNVHALGGFERARLYWLDPVDTGGLPITGYYIEQTGNGATSIVGGATPTFYPPGSGTTGAVIPNLTNGSSYVFRVRAVTAVGNGPWSENSNSVTPGPTTPEPPSLDSAAGDPATNGRITGSWSLASDYSDGGSALTGFKLTALSPDATPTTVTYGDSNARNGAVTGLTDNTKYKVEVTATNSYGEGSPSPVPITVLTRPGAPGTPTAGPTGVAGSVTLSFTLPTGGDVADLTNVRAKIGSTFSDPVDVPTACPDHQNCTITVTGVNVSSATTITVEAQNATGWGPDSGALVVPADTSPPTVAISFPSNPQYGTASWNAGCSNSGGAICGTASDNVPGAVANVTVTVKRSDNNRYWNGNPGTSNTQWPSTNPIILTATGTTSWQQALTTASLVNGVTYTITAQAKDTVNLPSTVVTRTFGYVTGAPTATLTAPANNANVSGSTTVSGNAGATSPATVASAEFQYAPHNSGTWTSIVVVTASPYTTPWDTTAISDGSYDLRMIVTDSAGNTTISSTRTVTIDNNPPTGELTAPDDNSYVRNTVAVSSNSADVGSGVDNATFQRSPAGANTWTTIGVDTTASYSVNWNTTTVPEGDYDLRVVTTDNAGESFTSTTRTVHVDNTAPTVVPSVVGTLGDNGWYTSDVAVTWTVSDAAGIASSTGCGPTDVTSNTTGQVVTCSATDNAGNVRNQSVTVARDATAPTGSLNAPADGATVAGQATVSSNSADTTSGVANATFQYSPAGAGSWSTIGVPDTTPAYSVSWNTGTLPQGNYDLRVVTTDRAGNTFTSPIRTVFVDSTPPTVTITFPVDGGAYNSTGWNAGCPTNQMCGTAADTAPGTVASVSVTIRRSSDNHYWDGSGTANSDWTTASHDLTVTGTTSWNRAFSTSTMSNGVTYTVTAVATDAAGLDSAPATAVFTYDTSAPSGSITAPSDNANVSGTVTVSSNSSDSGSGVASALFEYRTSSSGPWTAIGTDVAGAPWSVNWDTTGVANGLYDLRVTTTDNAGNSVTSSSTAVTVRVDNTPPTGTLTAPADGAYVKGSSVTVSSNSADSGGSGVANATFQRSPAGANTWTTIGTDASTPYSTTWNTTTLADESYDLQVITTDNAGNSTTSPTRTVKVDNHAPTIVADATGTVGSNGWYTTTVDLTWTVTDAFAPLTLTNCGPQSVMTDTSSFSFTCTATDPAGNSSNGTFSGKRDATDPTGSLTAPADGATVPGSVTVSSNSADAMSGVDTAVFQRSAHGANTWVTIATDPSSPYSQTWNNTALAPGSYDLRVVTTDDAGNTFTSPIRTVTVENTAPVPTSLVLSDSGSAGNGKAESGDRVTIVYSEPLDVSSVCTNWSGDTSNQSTTVTATLHNSGSSDYLTLGSPCANVGTIDTNRSYVSSNRNFSNTTVAWNVGSRTLTITLGTPSPTSGFSSNVSANTPDYTPTANISDVAGNAIDTTVFHGTSSRF